MTSLVRNVLKPGRLLGWLVLAVVLVLYVMPIVMLGIGAFLDAAPGQQGNWSLAGFHDAFTDPLTYSTFGNSVWLATMMGIIGTVVAAILARYAATCTGFVAKAITPMMVVALALPPLFFALSWDVLGTARVGLLNGPIYQALGFDGIVVGGAWGTAWFGGLKVASLVYFLLIGPFKAMDRRQEEAAVVAGASKLTTLLTVTLPALGPAMVGGFIIAFIIGLTSFDIPLILGLPEGFDVFSTQIYKALNENSPPNYAVAGVLALVLVVCVVILVGLRWWIIDRRNFATVGGKSGTQTVESTPRHNAVGFVVLAVYGILTLLLPLAQMIVGSLQPLFGAGSLSLANYQYLLNDTTLVQVMRNTILVAGLGGVLAVGLSFTLALVGRYGSAFMRRTLDMVTWLPWAANGILLGLGLVWTFIAITPLRSLFGTVWIVLIGLVVAATPIASRTIDGAIAQIGSELEEAGRVSGASALRVALEIVLRLMAPSMVAAWTVCAVNIAGNLEVPILLSLPTNRVMAVSVYQLYGNGLGTTAAALFCLVLAVGVAAAAIVAALVGLVRVLSANGGILRRGFTQERYSELATVEMARVGHGANRASESTHDSRTSNETGKVTR